MKQAPMFANAYLAVQQHTTYEGLLAAAEQKLRDVGADALTLRLFRVQARHAQSVQDMRRIITTYFETDMKEEAT